MQGVPWKRWIVVLLVLVVVVALVARRSGCSYRQRRARPQPVHAAQRAPVVAPGEVGAPLGSFTFKDMSGHEVSFEKLRGKILLIDFWAIWCAPCKGNCPAIKTCRIALVIVGR